MSCNLEIIKRVAGDPFSVVVSTKVAGQSYIATLKLSDGTIVNLDVIELSDGYYVLTSDQDTSAWPEGNMYLDIKLDLDGDTISLNDQKRVYDGRTIIYCEVRT